MTNKLDHSLPSQMHDVAVRTDANERDPPTYSLLEPTRRTILRIGTLSDKLP